MIQVFASDKADSIELIKQCHILMIKRVISPDKTQDMLRRCQAFSTELMTTTFSIMFDNDQKIT